MLALAPDAKAELAARRLANPAPWTELGATDALVWGRCQGSGRTPYEVAVLTVASAFAGPDDERVVVMPLTDEQIDAGQTVLAAWAEEDA